MANKISYALLTIALINPFYSLTAKADPTDAQVAGVLSSINSGEIKITATSIGHTTTVNVLRYAAETGADHVKSNADLALWSAKSGVAIESSPISQQYDQSAAGTANALSGLSGSAFDQSFLQAEVNTQQAAITALTQLSFFVHNAELMALIKDTIPTLQSHIQKAEQIQHPAPVSVY